MKILLLAITTMIIISSCHTNPEGNKDLNQISFFMDTVMVDSKGEFLFLNWELSTACVSKDGKTLYNLNIQEPSLEIIDLNNLQLIAKQVFDKEGPNGIGNKGRGGIVHLGEDALFFKGWPSPEIFNSEGKKSVSLKNLTDIKTKVTDTGKNFMYETIIPTDSENVFGLINEFPGKNFEFGRLNLLDSTLYSYPVSTLEKLEGYTITYDDGQIYDVNSPNIYVENINQYVVVSSSISSELYVYKPESDSLHHYTYAYNLTKSEKENRYPTEISDPKEFHNVFKALNSEVSFLPPIWDKENHQYYRFHYEMIFEDDFSERYPKKIGAKVYLSVYDQDFRLKAEGELPQFQDIPGFHFVKNGKIWMFKNLDDEMGFVIFTIS